MGARKVLTKRKVFGAFFLFAVAWHIIEALRRRPLKIPMLWPPWTLLLFSILLLLQLCWLRNISGSIYPSTAAELLSDDGRSEERPLPPPQKPSIVAVFHPCWNERWCRVVCGFYQHHNICLKCTRLPSPTFASSSHSKSSHYKSFHFPHFKMFSPHSSIIFDTATPLSCHLKNKGIVGTNGD